MIYMGKVKPSNVKGLDLSIMNFFKSYLPQEVIVPDDKEELATIKVNQLLGFISGKMNGETRNNESLISRDCLILDLDDVAVNEKELLEFIRKKFSKYDFILYPSISNGLKGVRYRFVLPLGIDVKESEYKLLINFFSNKVFEGILKEIDESNAVWSQLQLLPVLTQYNSKGSIIISKGIELFPTQVSIETAKTWEKDYQKQLNRTYHNTNKFKRNGSRQRNTTTDLFESLVAGCKEGNRNNRIAQITGGLLARAVDVRAVFELIKVANNYFDEPLSEKELEATFYSIAKKELS